MLQRDGDRDRLTEVLRQHAIQRAVDDAFADAPLLAGQVGREAADLASDLAHGQARRIAAPHVPRLRREHHVVAAVRLAHVVALRVRDLDRFQPRLLVEFGEHLRLHGLRGGGRQRERDAHEGARDHQMPESHVVSSPVPHYLLVVIGGTTVPLQQRPG